MTREIDTIVIVGGADAAVVAAAFAISLKGGGFTIRLVEVTGEEPQPGYILSRGGTHGFHALLGIDESELIDACAGYRLLGTNFRGFSDPPRDALVPLGGHGKSLRLVDFHQYVAKLRAAGEEVELNAFSLPAMAGRAGHFGVAGVAAGDAGKTIGFDVCVERSRYSDYLRETAAGLGVTVVRGPIGRVGVENGIVRDIECGGESVAGDLFIDCSARRPVASQIGEDDNFEDWAQWLPCDSRASVAVDSAGMGKPLATIEADDHGWTNRTIAGGSLFRIYAYSSAFLDDVTARERLAARVGSVTPDAIAVLKSRNGRRQVHWSGNCIALGAAAVTLEPMDISPMHVLQSGVLRLLAMLPRERRSDVLAAEFDRSTNLELDLLRDYLVLRYALARRQGPFWQQVAAMSLPESLRRRIELYSTHGRVTRDERGVIGKTHWVSSFVNLGPDPASYDPIADMIDEERMRADLAAFRRNVDEVVAKMKRP